MTMKLTDGKLVRLPKDPFAYIGFWQFLTFIMLILVVWVNEVRDMPSLLFGTDPQDVNIVRGCLLTAAVLVAAIVAIGNTYLQQKRVVMMCGLHTGEGQGLRARAGRAGFTY